MSGKKDWEVVAVLKQGEDVRKTTDEIFSRAITDCYRQYRAILADVTSAKDSAQNKTATLNEAAEDMFGDEGRKLLGEFRRVKESLSNQPVTDKGNALIDELSQLDNELKTADAKAQEIRYSIESKTLHDWQGRLERWYCDEEYRQAEALVRTYENLRSRRIDIERRMKKLLSDARQTASATRADSSQLENLATQIANLNATAQQRREADAFRQELRKALAAINNDYAEKFLPTDFATLRNSVENLISSNDASVLNSFQQQYANITDFQARLTKQVAIWQKQKDDAEALFTQLTKTAAEDFIAPVDLYSGKKNGQLINLFEYLNKFGGKDLGGKYAQQRDEAANLIRQEKFLESMSVMEKALDLVENARQEAVSLQESMQKKLRLAGTIGKVMRDLRYDGKTEFINGNPNDGVKIRCSIGDEVIDFQRVDIDENGNVVVNIDHQEGQGLNCAASWKDIAVRLTQAGIPLTDLHLENGRKILHPDNQAPATHGTVKQTKPAH